MRAIILAAGLSRRLGALTRDIPKCLLSVGQETLLRRTLRLCAEVDLKEIWVVTGHGAKHVEAEVADAVRSNKQLDIRCLYNAEYATRNNCYSLELALPEEDETIVIINSDDFFDVDILRGIARQGPSELVVDNVKTLTAESMKVYVQDDKITRIGKWLDIEAAAGEYIGLARIGAGDIAGLRAALRETVENNPDGFYEHAFDLMFDQVEIKPWNTNGLQWTEIDISEDLVFARELITKGLIQ